MGVSGKSGGSADEEPAVSEPKAPAGSLRLDSSHSTIRPTAPRAPAMPTLTRPLPPPRRDAAAPGRMQESTEAGSTEPSPTEVPVPPAAQSAGASRASAPTEPPPRPDEPSRRPSERRPEELNTQEIAIQAAPPAPIEGDAPAFARFGRFDLLGRIAVGGMAEILLARDAIEGAGSRQVVIKAVRGELAEDGDFAKMFTDEGRLAMRLTHPNICTVYECGRHQGRFFIAMEYVHGHTLREVMVRAAQQGRAMPIPLLLRIFALVAEALDYAHRAKDSQGRKLSIVHRDVSPHNVMIRYDGVVKLLDFGVAKAEHGQHSTESGALKGKFSYMSPEQALGYPVDARPAIFALGVCLFEAVTGRRLYHRKAQYDTLKAILEAEPPPLSAFRGDVPSELEDIVGRALAKDPEQRYQRAADLAHDLERLLAAMRAVASTAGIGELMEELFEDEARRGPELEVDGDLRARYASAREAAPIRATASRGTWIGAGLALLTVALLLGGLVVASIGPSEAPGAAAPAQPPGERPLVPPIASESTTQLAPIAAAPVDAADGTLAEPAPIVATQPEEEEPSRPPSTRATKRRRGRQSGRPGSTVIVTDPGF
jgi:serine/threonine-protein kinase